jgi:hypothetical protein
VPDLFPAYRHLVVVRGDDKKRFPARIIRETMMSFETNVGTFMKASGRALCDLSTKFEGPFTAEGDMESRP